MRAMWWAPAVRAWRRWPRLVPLRAHQALRQSHARLSRLRHRASGSQGTERREGLRRVRSRSGAMSGMHRRLARGTEGKIRGFPGLRPLPGLHRKVEIRTSSRQANRWLTKCRRAAAPWQAWPEMTLRRSTTARLATTRRAESCRSLRGHRRQQCPESGFSKTAN